MYRHLKTLEKDVQWLAGWLAASGYALAFDQANNLMVWPRSEPRPVSANHIRTFPFNSDGITQAFLWSSRLP